MISSLKNIAKTFSGTIEYVSPEFLNSDRYDNKVDIWSLGVILYELIAGYRPFEGKEDIQTKQPKDLPKNTSVEILNLLHIMLDKNPKGRPIVKEILTYSLIQPYLYTCILEGLDVY